MSNFIYVLERSCLGLTISKFEEALYNAPSIPEAIDIYVSYLKSTGNPKDFAHATKLLEYRDLISANITIKLRNVFDMLYDTLSEEYPDMRFRIAGRRKAFISLEQKIQKNISENKSLDLIRDMLGARIVLLNGAPHDCYTVMEKLVSCCINSGYTICEENSHNSAMEHLKGISPFLGDFYYGITDYIGNPKPNGYQSIHATFRNDFGSCFEVQVRNFQMHVNAVYGSSNHNNYKNEKYTPTTINFDRNRIKMYGYHPLGNGKAMDLIGLEYALELLQRNKTF